jgi:hypothetical protein
MTEIHFCIRGRLGNAIFRYLACVIMCIKYKTEYNPHQNIRDNNTREINDYEFFNISKTLLKNETINDTNYININHLIMPGFYQHDAIYNKYKSSIIDYIKHHPTHYISTDGITAGDGKCEHFNMQTILTTPSPPIFNKSYHVVLHLRLEDFVTHNLFISVDRILNLFKKYTITALNETLCILCKAPTTVFENNYIKTIKQFLTDEKKINVIIESNDTLTDYYIMKEATILICSKSTLSWCAAFFSDKIQKCYMPEYIESINSTCKYPIEKEKVDFY